MKLSVQPHQASQGRRFAIVDEHGDILLTTWDATDESRELAHGAAASSEMLAALKEAQAWLVGVVDSSDILTEDRECLERIEAAIAKAEGRSNG